MLQGENQICQKNVKEKDGHIKQLQVCVYVHAYYYNSW